MELIEIIVMRAQLAAMSADALHEMEDMPLCAEGEKLVRDEVRRRTEGPAS